jgi:hypothetical protein
VQPWNGVVVRGDVMIISIIKGSISISGCAIVRKSVLGGMSEDFAALPLALFKILDYLLFLKEH